MATPTLETLKQLDQAKYLACLFVPEQKREAFAALNAYGAELKRIPLLVSEPFPGEIRLQWWHDVISGERAGDAANHPVAAALLSAINDHHLPIAPLIAMLEARIFDLYQDPMPDIAAFETYIGETEASLIQLGSLILDPANAADAAEASGHAGMAVGIANVLQGLARATARQQIYLPADLLNAAGVKPQAIFSGGGSARSMAIIAMIALGRDHMIKFKRVAGNLAPSLRPAFLGTASCETVLRKAEKLQSRAFETTITPGPLLSSIRIAYRAMRGW